MDDKQDQTGLTRRELLGGLLLGASTGVILPLLTTCGKTTGPAKPDKRVGVSSPFDLVVVRGGEPAELVRAALYNLGGMKRFITRGDRVVIKPNIGFNRAPEQAANTNPLVVRELAVLALAAGAAKVTILDHTLYEPRNCYTRSGMAGVAESLGVELEFVEERKFVDVDLQGKWLQRWPLYRTVLEADKVINVPVAKQHSTARFSLGMKNMMGVIGGKRDSFHQNIHVALADLSAYLRPTLTVLDAYRVLMRNGPQGGSLDDVQLARTMAAGVDPVAVDAFGCSLFGVDPRQLGYIQEAEQRKLGVISLEAGRVKEIAL